MDSIAVGIRVRPLLPREASCDLKWTVQGNNVIIPTAPGGAGFEFNHVFGESVTTDQIYTTITCPIVHSVMEGFNGTVFAYGQTSSGKTFTMMGTEEHPGIIPLAIQEIFDYIEEHEQLEFIVRVSYLEIYKEGIIDLLDPACTELKIREDRDNNVRVHGLKEYVVTSIEEVIRVICFGNINRTTGETNMNERSSRSHAVLSIAVESRVKDGDGTVKVSSLSLVDLAGSERLNATGAAGKRAMEGIAINKSLFTLKQVISKLSEGNPSIHIPYRDSKLTHILKPSLGGNAKTAIICAVTPAEGYETELTLNFANCARKVKNRPIVNEVLGGEEALKKKLKQFERENEELKRKLISSESSLTEESKRELTMQISEKEQKQAELEARIHSLEQIIIKSTNCRSQASTETKPDRRKTICPASLARGMGSPLFFKDGAKPRRSFSPAATPELVHPAVSRVKRQVHFSPLEESFHTLFDQSGFERELDTQQEEQTDVKPVNVRDLERRRTMFRCPTFVVDTPASTMSQNLSPDSLSRGAWLEEGIGTGSPVLPQPPVTRTNAEVQTEAGRMCVASTQTTPLEVCEEDGMAESDHIQTQAKPVAASEKMEVELTTCDEHTCQHYQDLCSARAKAKENEQFHCDEREMMEEELGEARRDLATERERSSSLQQQVETLQAKLTDMEMASNAQEEYLMEMCQRSKVATQEHHQLEDKCKELEREIEKCRAQQSDQMSTQQLKDRCEGLEREIEKQREESVQWEEEKEQLHGQIAALREQLVSLQSELEMLPATKRRCSEPPQAAVERQQIAVLMQKLEEAEALRQKESEHFQQCYQQKLQEAQKAQELVCYLQEQLEEAHHVATPPKATPPPPDSHREELQQIEEELRQREAMLEEKSSQVTSLMEEVSALQSQLATLSEEAAISSYNHEQTLSSLGDELVEVKAALRSTEAARSGLETQLEHVTRQLHEVETTLQQRTEEAEKAQQLVCDLQKQIEENPQKDQLQKMERESKERETILEERNCEVASLREETAALHEQLVTLSKEMELCQSSHEQTLSSLGDELVEVRTALRSTEAARSGLETQLEHVTRQLHEVETTLQHKTEEAEKAQQLACSLQKQIEEKSQREQLQNMEKEAELEEKNSEIASLREKMSALHDQLVTISEEMELCQSSHEQTLSSLGDELVEVKAALRSTEAARSGLETQLEHVTRQLHEVETTLQRKTEEVNKAQQLVYSLQGQIEEMCPREQMKKMEEELGEREAMLEERNTELASLRKEVSTLNQQLVMCSEDYLDEIAEKEQSWEAEKAALQEQAERQGALNAELQSQVGALQSEVTQLKQTPPPTCPVAMAEAERKISRLMKQNEELKAQVRAHTTYQPTAAGELGCDGSGTITSAALYHLRGEMARVREEKEKLEGRVAKLKNELQRRQEDYSREKGECNRYREERNIFRAKYLDLKKKHAALQSAAPEVVLESSNTPFAQKPPQNPQAPPPPSCPQPPALSKPPVKTLPTPNHPPRRSIFSFVPQNKPQAHSQQNFQKRVLQDTLPQGLPPSHPSIPTREEVTVKGPNRAAQEAFSHSHALRNPAGENGTVKRPPSGFLPDMGQRMPDSMWDASIIQTRPEGMAIGRRDQDKCSQQ